VDEHQGCPARLGLAVNFVIHPKYAVAYIAMPRTHTPT
jgi:hypothetical protein